MSRLFILLTVAAVLAPSALAQSVVSGAGGSVVTTGPLRASITESDVVINLSAPEPFEPDVYPSQADAARGLGVLWAKRATERADSSAPRSVRIYCCDPALYSALRDGIFTRLPDTRIEKAPADNCPQGFHEGKPADGEAWVVLEADSAGVEAAAANPPEEKEAGESRPATMEPGGTLTLTARGASDAAAVTHYVDKPWVANFTAFVHAKGGAGRRWVVGRTDPMRPAMSEPEAADAAARAAAGELFGLVRARVPRAGRAGASDDWLSSRLEQRLAGGQLIADRFPQRFERPVGSTWREAVLLDASDHKVERLASDLRLERGAETRSIFVTLASAGGVLLVVYALYRLANAFTRGYFVWSLRTAAVAAATAVVVLVLMIVG